MAAPSQSNKSMDFPREQAAANNFDVVYSVQYNTICMLLTGESSLNAIVILSCPHFFFVQKNITFSHDHLKCGSILDRNPTMCRFISSANWKWFITTAMHSLLKQRHLRAVCQDVSKTALSSPVNCFPQAERVSLGRSHLEKYFLFVSLLPSGYS